MVTVCINISSGFLAQVERVLIATIKWSVSKEEKENAKVAILAVEEDGAVSRGGSPEREGDL